MAEVEDDEAIGFTTGVFEKKLQRRMGGQQVQGTTSLVVGLLLLYHKDVRCLEGFVLHDFSLMFDRLIYTHVEGYKIGSKYNRKYLFSLLQLAVA